MAWKASWAHRTGENEKKKDNDKIKKVGPNVDHEKVIIVAVLNLIWVISILNMKFSIALSSNATALCPIINVL